MSRLEFKLDLESIRPILGRVMPLLDSLCEELVAENEPPQEDEDLTDFWAKDLLNSQRKDVEAIADLFDSNFMDTGIAIVEEKEADKVIRGCSALRLKLRETDLGVISDQELESGDFDSRTLSGEQRLGYAAYLLFASLQELIISQMEL